MNHARAPCASETQQEPHADASVDSRRCHGGPPAFCWLPGCGGSVSRCARRGEVKNHRGVLCRMPPSAVSHQCRHRTTSCSPRHLVHLSPAHTAAALMRADCPLRAVSAAAAWRHCGFVFIALPVLLLSCGFGLLLHRQLRLSCQGDVL